VPLGRNGNAKDAQRMKKKEVFANVFSEPIKILCDPPKGSSDPVFEKALPYYIVSMLLHIRD